MSFAASEAAVQDLEDLGVCGLALDQGVQRFDRPLRMPPPLVQDGDLE